MKNDDDKYSDAEAVKRRESALKRMLSTPHTAHKDQPKKRKSSRAKKASPARKGG
jgi:hypothetical protein